MKSPVLFDFDGTLYDTEPIIREAYVLAGADAELVAETPVMEESWHSWLRGPYSGTAAYGIWNRKNAIYIRLLREAEPLASLAEARYLYGEGHLTGVLSAAPEGALKVLTDVLLPDLPFHFARFAMPQPDRLGIMQSLGPGGVYVDDQPVLIDEVERVGWSFVPAGELCAQCAVGAH